MGELQRRARWRSVRSSSAKTERPNGATTSGRRGRSRLRPSGTEGGMSCMRPHGPAQPRPLGAGLRSARASAARWPGRALLSTTAPARVPEDACTSYVNPPGSGAQQVEAPASGSPSTRRIRRGAVGSPKWRTAHAVRALASARSTNSSSSAGAKNPCTAICRSSSLSSAVVPGATVFRSAHSRGASDAVTKVSTMSPSSLRCGLLSARLSVRLGAAPLGCAVLTARGRLALLVLPGDCAARLRGGQSGG